MDQGGRIMRLHYEGILQERLDELGKCHCHHTSKERLDDPDRYHIKRSGKWFSGSTNSWITFY